jgi:uncharacterized protein (TIGR02611 family)
MADSSEQKLPEDSSDKSKQKSFFTLALRQGWRLIIVVGGFTILLLGVIMIVTPGPALVFIPLGLGILAAEFVWARRLLRKLKDSAKWPLTDKQKQAADRSEP